MHVRQLRELIASRTGIPPARQRLIYIGTPLKDESFLGEYGIQEGHVIHLVQRPEETPSAAPSAPTSTTPSTSTAQPTPPAHGAQIPQMRTFTFNFGQNGHPVNVVQGGMGGIPGVPAPFQPMMEAIHNNFLQNFPRPVNPVHIQIQPTSTTSATTTTFQIPIPTPPTASPAHPPQAPPTNPPASSAPATVTFDPMDNLPDPDPEIFTQQILNSIGQVLQGVAPEIINIEQPRPSQPIPNPSHRPTATSATPPSTTTSTATTTNTAAAAAARGVPVGRNDEWDNFQQVSNDITQEIASTLNILSSIHDLQERHSSMGIRHQAGLGVNPEYLLASFDFLAQKYRDSLTRYVNSTNQRK